LSVITAHSFPIHDIGSAPVGSRPALERLKASVGMIPNLGGAMAESPVLIESFETTRTIIRSIGTFTAQESEAISLANAVENGCHYCTAIHATFALGAGLDAAEVEAIRRGDSPASPRLAALVRFARELLRTRGQVDAEELNAFVDAGLTPAQALELVARLANSVMANYASHLTHPAPDDAIKPNYRAS
jgi:AhpD family alkylhydroperoxidase